MIAAGAPVGADEVAHALESLDEEERVLREELAEVLARRRMLDELLKARQGKVSPFPPPPPPASDVVVARPRGARVAPVGLPGLELAVAPKGATPRVAPADDAARAVVAQRSSATPRVAPVATSQEASSDVTMKSSATPRVAPADTTSEVSPELAMRSSATPRVAPTDATSREASPELAARSSATPRVAPDPEKAAADLAARDVVASPLAAASDDENDEARLLSDASSTRLLSDASSTRLLSDASSTRLLADPGSSQDASSARLLGPRPAKRLGWAASAALGVDVALRSGRVAADVVAVVAWARRGSLVQALGGLACLAAAYVLEVGVADDARAPPGAAAAAAAGLGLAFHARESCRGGRRTESYATLRAATTLCAFPVVLARAYDAAAGGWRADDAAAGLALGVADQALAAAAATLGAPTMWRALRSARLRVAALAALCAAYGADVACRTSAYAAVARASWAADGEAQFGEGPDLGAAAPLVVLAADVAFLVLVSRGCARHDRRGRGTRGRAAVRAFLWLAVDVPLDYDRHVRLAWAHRAVVAFHGALHVGLNLRYRRHAPLARFVAGDDYVAALAALAGAKVLVFVGFWAAHALFAAGDPARGDAVAVAPDSAPVELRAMLPARRRNLV